MSLISEIVVVRVEGGSFTVCRALMLWRPYFRAGRMCIGSRRVVLQWQHIGKRILRRYTRFRIGPFGRRH